MAKAIKKGFIKGIGINDTNIRAYDYKDTDSAVMNPYYCKWSGVLGRTQTHGSTICDEWLYLSNFVRDIKILEDIHQLSVYTGRACCLDKDLKVLGNKHYSLDTCLLVSNMVNCLFQDSSTIRGELPLGVTLRSDLKGSDVYRSQTSDPFTHRQTRKSFDCPIKAHRFWQETKLKFVKQVYDLQNEIVKDALMQRILILEHDLDLNLETHSLSNVKPA